MVQAEVAPPGTPAPPPGAQLLQMGFGGFVAQAISVAAQLGLADLIHEGPKTASELAEATGAHAPSLYRLLRALASVGVFAEDGEGRFGMTPLATALRSDTPGSIRHGVVLVGQSFHRQAWTNLLYSVTTGRPAFDHAHGQPFFDYLGEYPEALAAFQAWMSQASAMQVPALLGSYDFSPFRRVVDVGGGRGDLLASLLRANPEVRGILFDLPQVVAGARAIEDSGVADRCQVMGGDFFTAVPEGGDAYLLKMVIHDWDDDRAVRILRNCCDAMAPDGKVLVMEMLVPPGNAPHFSKFMDLNMLVLNQGGLERTEAEYRDLFRAAGLALTRVVPTPSPFSIVEGVRV